MIDRRGVALLFGLVVLSASSPASAGDPGKAKLQEVPGVGTLMPLRFTTFGDFYYSVSDVERDDFHIGTLELDVSLPLNDYVDVTAGLTFDGRVGTFGIGSFTIDCGIAGNGSHYLFPKSFFERSGIVFGKFDVPFGIAYLEYPSSDNRLVTLPNAARATHGGWSDIGVQIYAQERHANFIGYLVNGSGLDAATGASTVANAANAAPDPNAPADPNAPLPLDDVAGGRIGLTLIDPFEVGFSGAVSERDGDFVSGLYGGDLRAAPGGLDLRVEYIERVADVTVDARPARGAYGRALFRVDRLFATARYGLVFDGAKLVDREVVAGVGATVFPKAEIRVVDQQDLETGASTVFFQLVGGSAWQPTGFRR